MVRGESEGSWCEERLRAHGVRRDRGAMVGGEVKGSWWKGRLRVQGGRGG